jgi:hypothetical protein
LGRFLRQAECKNERKQREGRAKEEKRGEAHKADHDHANSRCDYRSEIVGGVKITDAFRPVSLWANVDDHDDGGRIEEGRTNALKYSHEKKRPKRRSDDITN